MDKPIPAGSALDCSLEILNALAAPPYNAGHTSSSNFSNVRRFEGLRFSATLYFLLRIYQISLISKISLTPQPIPNSITEKLFFNAHLFLFS